LPNQPRMARCQILSQPLGNAPSLDEDMVGMQLALHRLTVSRRFPVQVLIPITLFQRLHCLHPEMVVECPKPIPSPNGPISCCTKFLINPPQICSLLKGLVNTIRFGHFRKHF
jgi:hypothetical protein